MMCRRGRGTTCEYKAHGRKVFVVQKVRGSTLRQSKRSREIGVIKEREDGNGVSLETRRRGKKETEDDDDGVRLWGMLITLHVRAVKIGLGTRNHITLLPLNVPLGPIFYFLRLSLLFTFIYYYYYVNFD